MRTTHWVCLLAGVLLGGIAAASSAEEAASPVADPTAASAPVSAWLKRVDTERWQSFLEDTMRALQERAEDSEAKAETRKAIEEGAQSADEVIARLVGVAESLEKTVKSPEFKALVERVGKDVDTAAESMKEVDYSGMNKMLEAMTRQLVEPLEVVADQFDAHFGAGESPAAAAADDAPAAGEVEAADW
jgi:hypothetical protein